MAADCIRCRSALPLSSLRGSSGFEGKLELARVQTALPKVNTAALRAQTVAAWLDTNVSNADARGVLEMLVRLSTFTDDPDRQSAGAAIEQLQLALGGSVLFLDGGWQTIVNGLRSVAAKSGATFIENAHAVGLERPSGERIDGVRLADGNVIRAAAAIVTGSPADVDAIIGGRRRTPVRRPSRSRRWTSRSPLCRGRERPSPSASMCRWISLCTPRSRGLGQMAARSYTSAVCPSTPGVATENELESLLDLMQPGWRERIVAREYLPSLTVTHAELTAERGGTAGRPSPRVGTFENVFIAGDWIGSRGQLSDAAAASANDAAACAIRPAVPDVA